MGCFTGGRWDTAKPATWTNRSVSPDLDLTPAEAGLAGSPANSPQLGTAMEFPGGCVNAPDGLTASSL